ncbi:MAG: TonB-dependent receptor [Proteobacteria bacterium]|nr:TonB-dependent receptor [Pseudomonadota bacterium]
MTRRFRPKADKLSVALVTAIAISATGASFAQTAPATDDTDTTPAARSQTGQATTLDKVSVTGSRIKRVDVEGPAPVTVITAEEIQKSGLNTVYEVLNTLTQVTGDVDNEMNPGSWTPNGAFINLRAMGPGYTLTLVNGRRMADYPLSYRGQSNAVSTSSIPAGAVERIEVLSGGASAIYGSDAVAGVVNVITKENYEGDEVRLKGATTTQGGGDNVTFQWTGGRSGERWSATYGAEYYAREGILASQRDFMDSYYDNPAFRGREEFVNNPAVGIRLYRYAPNATYPVGVPTTSNYWLGADGSLIAENAAGGAGIAALRNNCAQFGVFEPYNTSAAISNVTGTPNGCGFFGQPATQTIQSKYDRQSVFASGTYDFEGGVQLYGQFLGTRLESMTANGTRFIQPPGGTIYSPTLGRMYFLRHLTLAEIGSPQQILHEEKSFNLAAGLRGTFFSDKFDWDFGVAHSRFEYEGKRPWLLTGPTLGYFFGGVSTANVPGTTIPIYPNMTEEHLRRWLSPITPELYRTFADDLVTTGESKSTQVNFTVGGDLFDLPAGALGMAAVIEWGSQEYEQVPDIRTTTDYTGPDRAMGLTSTRGSGERDRYAFGVEFSIPIFSQLKASLAGRYDNIDGMAESARTWSAGLEYRPFSNLMLRGNYATSYRAPDMAYVFAEESGGYGTYNDYYRCRRDGLTPTSGAGNPCSTSANPNLADYRYQIFSLREGTPDLGPEKGKSFTAGFVWDVIDGMSLSMDYYSIELEGKVQFLDADYLLRTEADCRLGRTEAGAAVDSNSTQCQDFMRFVERTGDQDNRISTFWTYPYNQALTKTSGIDTSWRYRFTTGWGNFNLSAGHTIVLELEDQPYAGGAVLDRRVNRQYFDFRSRANWGINWNRDSWSAYLSGYRLGSLPNWAEDGRIDPFVIWNGSVSKQVTEKMRIGFQVTNILDERPPQDETFDAYPYFWRSYQVGAIGRQIGADIVYKF